MKIALLGDCHFGASRSSVIVHNYFEKFYKFFFEYLDNNNISTVIQEGDLFDQRKDVHFTTVDWVDENFFSPIYKQEIDLYVIAGNHDILYNNTSHINSVSLLCPKSVAVVDLYPRTYSFGGVNIDFYPWINSGNEVESLEFLKNSKSTYAVGHFQFADFPMHPGTLAESGMDHKTFSKYDEVFSGHFHTISKQNNTRYTGTPCELNWSDCEDPKGFWILDTENGNTEFVQNPFTLFEKISYVEDMVYDFTQAKDKFIKVVVVAKKSQKKFDSFMTNINHNKPHDVKIIESSFIETVSDAVKIADAVSTQVMISSVIDTLDIQLDKAKLKHYILDMYAEAEHLNKTL